MSELPEKQMFCPQCKTWFPVSYFNSLPLDLRCNKCLPVEAAMDVYDQKVALAGQKLTKVLSDADIGKSLTSLSRMVEGFYDEYGGAQPLLHDAAQWVKDLAATGKKTQALAFLAKLFSIHAKVERTQVDEDWNNLTRAEIESRLAIKMAAIMAKYEAPALKQQAINKITGLE